MNKKSKIFTCVISAAILAVLILFTPKGNEKESNPGEIRKETIQEEYKIGFITDIHGRKSTKGAGKPNMESEKTLTYFAERMNNDYNPDFVVNGGDLIEGTDREGQKSIDDFKTLADYFKIINAPSYHINGNHEMRGFSKNEWLNLTGYEKNFYYFDYKNLRAIILDGNENEKAETSIQNYNKNCYYLSEEQFEWLEKVLSEGGNMKKIIFIHYPPFETPGTKMIEQGQSSRLREIFSRNKVSAVFSGHTEKLEFKEIDGVKYFVIPGTEKSKKKAVTWLGSFSEITVGKEIIINFFYKKERDAEYKTLKIPSEEFDRTAK